MNQNCRWWCLLGLMVMTFGLSSCRPGEVPELDPAKSRKIQRKQAVARAHAAKQKKPTVRVKLGGPKPPPIPAPPLAEPAVPIPADATPAQLWDEVVRLRRHRDHRPDDRPESLHWLQDRNRAIAARAERILAADPPEPLWTDAARARLDALLQLARRDALGLDPLRRFADSLIAARPHTPLAAEAGYARVQAVSAQRAGAETTDALWLRTLVAEIGRFTAAFPDHPRAVFLLVRGAQLSEQLKDFGRAKEFYRAAATRYPRHPRHRLFLGAIQRIDARGKPVQLEGPTLAGEPLDLSRYRGRLVLVHFWSSASPACLGQILGLKQLYTEYHDAGLELVGVSLDHDPKALKRAVTSRDLPWPQVFFADTAQQSWHNPLVEQYGILHLPATLLIDRDGRLVGLFGRAEEFEREVNQRMKPLLVTGKRPARSS